MGMTAHLLLINSFFSRTGAGLSRDIRLITQLGGICHPVVAAIDTNQDQMDATATPIIVGDDKLFAVLQ